MRYPYPSQYDNNHNDIRNFNPKTMQPLYQPIKNNYGQNRNQYSGEEHYDYDYFNFNNSQMMNNPNFNRGPSMPKQQVFPKINVMNNEPLNFSNIQNGNKFNRNLITSNNENKNLKRPGQSLSK
jgi:hypothetical protein